MPREVALRLEALLAELAPGTLDNAELAQRLGIGEATLKGYRLNRWTVLDRVVLERLLDLLDKDVPDLLVTTESPFFSAFSVPASESAQPTCVYLRRPDAPSDGGPASVAYRDYRAFDRVADLLRDNIPTIMFRDETSSTTEDFKNHLLENCLVVGSPMVNPAADLAIRFAFGADPFGAKQADAIPFSFKGPAAVANSQSASVDIADRTERGIWLKEQATLIKADFWPRDEFRKNWIQQGRDCALIMVVNHPTGGQSPRKLVLLAGALGAGTEAAGRAFVDYYRDLEPRNTESVVWGVIEVLYRKPRNSMTREIVNYKWKYRIGGRCPIDFVRGRAQTAR